jgi:hypothetical protein
MVISKYALYVHNWLQAHCQALLPWILPLHASQFVSNTNSNFLYDLQQLMTSFWFTNVTLNFIQPHRKESNGTKLGDWVDQVFGPPLPIHIPLKFSFRSSVTPQVESWGSLVMLQPQWFARTTTPINSSLFTFQKKSCNRVVLKHLLINVVQKHYGLILHITLPKKLCSTT